MDTLQLRRSWDVLLLGGASGAGKTSLSYRLARTFDIALTEIDDFQVLLEAMTTPEQMPALHFWSLHPNPQSLHPADIADNGIAIGETMLPGLVAVILNHLEAQTPVVLEGDFLLPALTSHPAIAPHYSAGRVRMVIVHEAEAAQLLENFLRREPDAGPQHLRAEVSWHYGRRLAQEAVRYNIPVLPARPWETAFERLLALCVEPTAEQ